MSQHLTLIVVLMGIGAMPMGTWAEETKRPASQEASEDPQTLLQQAQQHQAKVLERLREVNPTAHQQLKEAQDRQNRIQTILLAFRTGTLSSAEARNQLLPLVQQDVQERLTHVDVQIAELESEISRLKAAKRNPQEIARRQVDILLGLRMPDAEMLP